MISGLQIANGLKANGWEVKRMKDYVASTLEFGSKGGTYLKPPEEHELVTFANLPILLEVEATKRSVDGCYTIKIIGTGETKTSNQVYAVHVSMSEQRNRKEKVDAQEAMETIKTTAQDPASFLEYM